MLGYRGTGKSVISRLLSEKLRMKLYRIDKMVSELAGKSIPEIVEQDGWDSDSFAKTWDLTAKFPDMQGVGRESATASAIQMGVLAKFVDEATWLFYRHVEDKYPDAV